MSVSKTKIESPLAKARGTGAAHNGVDHWIAQRITAVANIPLMLWLVWSVVNMQGWSHEVFTAWLAAPLNTVLMILAVISVFYHAALGLQVIIEDYVHQEACKITKLLLMRFFFFAAGVGCIFSILKVAFTAG